MRTEDVAAAVDLGASHVGVILAEGPRMISEARASELLAAVPPGVARVGVFAAGAPATIAGVARAVGLTTVQLHGAPDAEAVDALRRGFTGEIWAVVRVQGDALPMNAERLFETADAVLLDAHVPGRLGGTGVVLPWRALREPLARMRTGRRLILAGGLRAENVAEAIAALHPEVVDVSSGVESSPGVKDHSRMRAFRDAVRGAN